MMVYVLLSCLFLVALWSPAGKAAVFVVFCHFPKCVLVHMRIKGEVGTVKLVKYFTDRSKAVLLLWIFYDFSVLCLLCLCACLFVPCGHLLRKG